MKVKAELKAYEFMMPEEVKSEFQKCVGDKPHKGNVCIMTKNFSHEAYDDAVYNSGMFGIMFELLTEHKITEEQFRSIKICEAVYNNKGLIVRSVPCKYQDFEEAKLFLNN